MSNPTIAKYLVLIGLLIIIIGIIWYFVGDRLHWLGNLPGDIRIKREGFNLYFPLTTGILISVLLNLILWLIRRLMN